MKIPKSLLTLILAASWPAVTKAEIKTETIEYKDGDTVCEGYLAYDDAAKGPQPGILICHDWTGLQDYTKRRAREVAALGYVAFCPDIYGKGVRPTDPKVCGETAGIYKNDRDLLRRRVNAGYDVLKKQKMVDPDKTAVMGYCFGGMVALELARGGADVEGVVTFHGALNSPTPEDAKNIKGKVLVLHGADDPFVPPAEVAAFKKEMQDAKVDFEFVPYPNAVHSFTNPAAGNDNSKGAAYNEPADRNSWEAMKQFFTKLFS